MADVNNVTADTFSHTFNTQRENVNAIFTSEKLDKSDDLVHIVNNLTINDARYYEPNTVTASDTQGDLTRNPETSTHTSNGNETVIHTINGNFEQKLLSNRTIPIVPPAINPGIDQWITSIVLAPQTLLAPEIKEVIMDVASGSTWVNSNPQQLIWTGVNGSTLGNIYYAADYC